MATTTTNFGWDIPQSTDLVKDGATAIAALGQDIDTALVDLKGGTTGQVLAKASGTDLDFSWVAQDDSNAIQNAIVDAKGDLISATAADTPARLAVGANDTVLTADSSTATGLKWAAVSSGGMTLINTGGTTLSGASVLISSIPTTYKHLCVIIRNFVPSADNAYLNVRYNDDSTANRHRGNWGYFSTNADGATAWAFDSTTSRISSNNDNSVGNGLVQAWFFDYANTSTWKSHSFQSLGVDGTTTTSFNILSAVGQYNQTTAITSLRFLASTGNLTSGTVFVYGVN